jgi:hypothetical protein
MPMGPHRTSTVPVNVRDLDRFDDGAEVTPETLAQIGLIRNTRTDVKILGHGELKKKLTVTAHFFSASAREKIEGAGGSVTALKEVKKKRRRKKASKGAPAPAAEAAPEETTEVEEPQAEAEPEAAEAEAAEPEAAEAETAPEE